MTIKHLESTPAVEIYQSSDAGLKSENQDSIGARIPDGFMLTSKGIAIAIADGVSAAEAAQEASQACITGFLTDYFSTPDTWSVKKSALKVLQSLNRWLYGQSQSHIKGRGFLSTLSVLVIKANAAHIFHVGDSRIYRLRNNNLELLTTDHTRHMSGEKYYLSRAMGADTSLDIDYKSLNVQKGDQFLLTTDGIHDVLNNKAIKSILENNPPDTVVKKLTDSALTKNSQDNLSCQLLVINELNSISDQEAFVALKELPFPPDLNPGQKIDDLTILDLLHDSERSQLYLVEDKDNQQYVMKTPSINYEDDPGYIERFVLEEWIGSRVSSNNIVKTRTPKNRTYLYYLTQHIQGPTLEELLIERGQLDILDAIQIIEQISKGLRALHRKETLHQDIKPANIIISDLGAVLIDFGSCSVAGIEELNSPFKAKHGLGTVNHSAPECSYGGLITERSDQFSLAVLLYEMLTGKLPYSSKFEAAKSLSDFQKLKYQPAYIHNPMVPTWLDSALQKALSVKTEARYDALSEFLYDLKKPNQKFIYKRLVPLIERNPLKFWQVIAGLLVISNLIFIYKLVV